MTSAPNAVVDLVERFDSQLDAYRSGRYKETPLRRDFIDPLFEALGWDINNRAGYAEAYRDVIHEDAIKVGGVTKAPDYCFRVGGRRIFFLEAKKPSVDIATDVHPAYQLRRYAWSAKLPLSVLTDFEEFAVYDCRIRPKPTDKPAVARTMYLKYTDYAAKWDQIKSIFARQSVLKGSFDKYVASSKKRGTAEVDAEFLKEIEKWRDALARNIALRNRRLKVRDLNFAVQRTIDRVIFLRMAEGRGIETQRSLQSLISGQKVYARLMEMFRAADDRYNSGLFHFRQNDPGHTGPPDGLTPGLKIDDKVLKHIFKGLYYPASPYEFSVLGADILGNVYEQFLGKVIRLTAGHHARVEKKPEVKKAGGVFYTPKYIVDYIVKHTVGRLVEDKTPQEIGGLTEKYRPSKARAPLRILDPACGSGSFLVGAYKFLLDYHRDWYLNDSREHPEHRQQNTKYVYQGKGGQWFLTTAEKKRILLSNIYGVDIDSQAVEVTKLNLLLCMLENENQGTIDSQLKMWHERALPDLGDNIKCGNSLIGPDFYQGEQMSLFDEEARHRINAFDWPAEFPNVFDPRLPAGRHGFDAVIGNPPWGAAFSDQELAYLRNTYARVVDRMVDSYIYFIDRAFRIARAGFPVGFIIPSTLLNQVEAKSVRALLLERGIGDLVNLGRGIFGTKVLNTSTIFVSESMSRSANISVGDLSRLPLQDRVTELERIGRVLWRQWQGLVSEDAHITFHTGGVRTLGILSRMRDEHLELRDILEGSIQRGVSPDFAAAHVLRSSEVEVAALERTLLRPSISGVQIKRYQDWSQDQYIIYTTRDTDIAAYANVFRHLKTFKHRNTCREVREGKHPWWALHRPRDVSIFKSPKLIGLTTCKTIQLAYDPDSSLYVTDAMYVFRLAPGHDVWSCIGVLQSRAFLFFYRVANQGESRVIPQVKASKLNPLPFPKIDLQDARAQRLSKWVRDMYALNRDLAAAKTAHDKNVIQRQIDSTDKQIDQLVYELYGLTEDEIKIVEEATGSEGG